MFETIYAMKQRQASRNNNSNSPKLTLHDDCCRGDGLAHVVEDDAGVLALVLGVDLANLEAHARAVPLALQVAAELQYLREREQSVLRDAMRTLSKTYKFIILEITCRKQ